MKKSFIIDLIAGLFVLLFIYAAVSKWLDYDSFRIQLAQSPLLYSLNGFVSIAIPSIEILISIMLATARWQLQGFYAAFTLMVMFSTYIIIIIRYSEFIPCSCGGVLSKMNWNQHLIFNVSFIMLAAIGVLLSTQEFSSQAPRSV